MKVAIVTTEDLFYVRHFFKAFLNKNREESYTLMGITILPAFNKPLLALIKQMLGFYGVRLFIKMGFLHVWRKLSGATIERLASDMSIPLISMSSVNSEAYIAWLKENSIDLIISIASPEIFKEELLTTPAHGCINSHSALLPENRGMMPVFWALYKGDKELGVTIHTMDTRLDSGAILAQETVVNNGESLNNMILETKEISAQLMHQVLMDIAKGTQIETPMKEGGSYQTFPTPTEVTEFLSRGNRHF